MSSAGRSNQRATVSLRSIETWATQSDKVDKRLQYFTEILGKATKIEEANSAENNEEKEKHREKLKKLFDQNSEKLRSEETTLQQQNFLHFLASQRVYNMSSSEAFAIQNLVARMLLEKEGRELLMGVDSSDNTPLHTATLQCNRCFLGAVSGPPSLDATITEVRETIERNSGKWAPNRAKSTFLHMALLEKSFFHDEKLLLALIELAPKAMLSAQDFKEQTALHIAVDYSVCTADRLAVVKRLIARNASVLAMTDENRRSVYQHHVLSKPKGQNNTGSGRLYDAELSEKMKDELLLASMRTMKCNTAQRCLHVQNDEDKELWFDYMPARTADMTFEKFKRRWGGYNFQATLQYVSIANVKFKRGQSVSRVTKQSRDGATQIIRWLLRDRKVKKILRITVDDMGSNYHSNDTIERALKDTKVEELDWKRPDLCPATIFNIGSNLRVLHLYWGGNNAILRAWSEAEGLPMLAQYGNLEHIFITRPKSSPDMSSRRLEQEKQFNDRLRNNWKLSTKPPQIYHEDEETSAQFVVGENDNTDGQDQHRWIRCMEDFIVAFRQIDQPPNSSPVEVALIDDGVDMEHPLLRDKTYRGRSFAFDHTGTRSYPYWGSDSDHGTIMASFINKFCPTANIYIIKVATRQGGRNSNRLTIDVHSAVEAINHAVDRKVKIISMSWSVKPPANRKLRQSFNDAVQRAISRNIIMLCASSDRPENGNDETYPHKANSTNVIRIGAATATGNNAEYVNKSHIDFLFPGHEIALKASNPEKELGDVHKGSSVATAIASGLAALILECIRISCSWKSNPENQERAGLVADADFENMDSEGMKAIFKGIGMSNSRYIWVWKTFTDDIREKIVDGGCYGKNEAITSLVDNLLKNRV